MVFPGRPYHFKFFKGSFPEILLGPVLNTLAHLIVASDDIAVQRHEAFNLLLE